MIWHCFILCCFVHIVTSNSCRDGLESIGQKCYNITNSRNNFVGCAKICEEGNGTLPCIETEEESNDLFELVNGELGKRENKTSWKDAVWVGLYQDPGIFYKGRGWKNWHRGGCKSMRPYWKKGEPDDFSDMQQACAAVYLGSPYTEFKWNDARCSGKVWNNVRCVCQEGGERDDAFDEDMQKELLVIKSKYQTEVGFSFTFICLIPTVILIAYGIYTFRRMSHTKERRSHVAMIILLFMSYIMTLSMRLLKGSVFELLQKGVLLNAILPISIISMLSIMTIQAFYLLDSIILAIGGVREAKKSWIKRMRQSIFFFAVLALIGASIMARNIDNKYGNPRDYVFSEFMLAFSSIFFVGVAIVFLSLYAIFSVESNSNIRCQKMIKKLIQWLDIGRKEDESELLFLKAFKNTERNNEIRMMSLYFGVLLSVQVVLDYFFLSSSVIRRASIVFIPTILLMGLLLHDINKAEKQGKKSFKKKSFYWKSIQFGQSGIDIFNTNEENILRKAPHAGRPDWLFNHDVPAKHQSELSPTHWTISICNLIRFFEECVKTQTWLSLALARDGEEKITMHDINTHFVVPWSRGTGSSIGLLCDPIPRAADLMISHSWSGSVMETVNALKTLVTMHFIPEDSRVFFCTLCQYQPEDGAPGGLTIKQQLDMNPFGQVISSRPKYGMYVVHTLLSEVYDRLWCVSEVYEARKAGIEITGIFDPHAFSAKGMTRSLDIKTENASCATESDKTKLTAEIKAGGGFMKLDKVIRRFRRTARSDLQMAIIFKSTFGIDVTDFTSSGELTMLNASDDEDDIIAEDASCEKSEGKSSRNSKEENSDRV